MKVRWHAVAVILLCLPAPVLGQRELHWDALTVTAHLNADGSLTVVEEQTMVFSGDWNGGERVFRIRPRQTLSFDGMSRWNGGAWQPMREHGGLTSVDDYSLTGGRTLRWRSRLPSDPPFNRTSIRYQLRYALSGILLQDGDRFTLDHDFAFPDRTGSIDRFELMLTLDPAWQPLEGFTGHYAATGLAPGKSYVVTLPLQFEGTGTPKALDVSRPPAVLPAVIVLIGVTLLALVRLVATERKKGRFIAVQTAGIDEAWLREHILKFPAEMIAAAWDDRIRSAEVVTLLARMSADGTLESRADDADMTLRLLVDRQTLSGYERKLVDALFFDGRTTTNTRDIKEHYRNSGLNLVEIIRADLAAATQTTFPLDRATSYGVEPWLLALGGIVLAIAAWLKGELPGPAVFLLPVWSLVLGVVASIGGWRFRKRMDLGLRSMALSLVPPLVLALAAVAFVWFAVGRVIPFAPLSLASLVALVLAAVVGSINSLRSRQRPEGIAFRKRLAAGRLYFQSQLAMPQPALRDAWYPWLLAFELGKEIDRWSVHHVTSSHAPDSYTDDSVTASSTHSGASSAAWSGFGGGRSGGAGGGAAWAAAAGGLASGVASPSSSSSSSDGGSSSGGGSSGGGGGGGW